MINLWDIPVIDHHAHNLFTPEVAEGYPYSASFTEGYDDTIVNIHARNSLFYRRSIREIAQLLECEPTEDAILACRQEFGLEKLTERCLTAANIEAIFLDDGFLTSATLPWTWHQKFTSVQRVVRIEYLAETLIPEFDKFEDFLAKFKQEINPSSPEVVAFKSIAAYRSGLNIQLTPIDFAEYHFNQLKQQNQEKLIFLKDKPFIDFLLNQTLDVAEKYQIPIQFHTGFGDPEIDLSQGNPLLLRSILEEKRWQNVPIVLLHGSYPYSREAGYLASVYPQVYLDYGLAIPFLSVNGMRSTLRQLLELAPTTKLMYSSDAHNIPELYYLGAKWGREILEQVLEESVQDGDLTVTEAEVVARDILAENARSLYLKTSETFTNEL